MWWDFENCNIPAGANVFKVAQSITAAIRVNGIKGPIQITAFGDVLQLSRSNQEALSSTGINLTHIPRGGKNSADRSLLIDLMYWVSQNPPPAHLFVISGDRDFATILHRLRMNNYNILLASPESAPSVLCSAASIMWQWNALVRGENIVGKRFNQPPDGPHGSWYGHYRVPLEDPFTVADQPASQEDFLELKSDSNPESSRIRPVPKNVEKQIRQILNSYPKGISITEFRSELLKTNVSMDRDYYGYKKFSSFLLSMPHVLKIQSEGAGRYLIQGVNLKIHEPLESGSSKSSSRGRSTSNGDNRIYDRTQKLKDDVKPSLPSSSPLNVEKLPMEVKVTNADASLNANLSETQLPPMKEELSPSERNDISIREDTTSSTYTSDKLVVDDKSDDNVEALGDNSSKPDGFFKKFMNWFRSWRFNRNSINSSGQSSENLDQMDSRSEEHELFSNDAFWNDMESFLGSPKGSALVSHSRTREEMGDILQKEGPSILKSLTQIDLLHLVNVTIMEKKWVKESGHHTFPFRVIFPAEKISCLAHSQNKNGLSSIFLERPPSQSKLHKQPEDKREKKNQVSTFVDVSPPVTNIKNKPSEKSRTVMLADCQKLASEIVEENPEGVHISYFSNSFLDRYGYSLDLQKLGYQNLTSLLQIIPGVKIDSVYIYPRNKTSHGLGKDIAPSSDSELSDESLKQNSDSHSPWEELGPLTNPKSDKSDMAMSESMLVEYEPLSEDELEDEHSDSEGDVLEKKMRNEATKEESTLLHVLDSWYSRKEHGNSNNDSENLSLYKENVSDEDEDRKDDPENINDFKQNSIKESKSSWLSSDNSEVPVVKKRRSSKSYSFVSDQDNQETDKMVGGILSCLAKSDESRMQGLTS